MAQTNYTPVSLYYSTTASAVPTAANLVPGELAININDGKLYYEDSSGVVQTLATKGAGTAAGSTTQVQYNSSGAFAGSANMTFDGTTFTLANNAVINGLSVGKGANSVATNTGLGVTALAAGTLSGANNTAGGYQSGNALTSGSQNTSYGSGTLLTGTTSSQNTAIGYQSLRLATTTGNTGVGWNSGASTSSGQYNTACGWQAFFGNQTGSFNTAIGGNALTASTGNSNTAVGYTAGNAITSGTKNSILGTYTGNSGGLDIRTASNYIVLSDGDANIRASYNATGVQFLTQAAPTSKSTTATLTAAEVLTGILNTTGTSYTVTLPLGSALDTGTGGMPTDTAFTWSVINTASGTVTIAVNTGITSLGTLTIATGTSATFIVRKTAASTFVIYTI